LFRPGKKHTLTGDRVVVSTDLTAASDRIPHCIAKVIWETILDNMGVIGVERELVLDSLGPQYLVYDDE